MRNKIVGILLAIVALLGGGYAANDMIGATEFNQFNSPTVSATTTTSALPVLVLDKNTGRQYAHIQNDSDTVIYLYLDDFASADAASTTVALNKGIRLNASGGSYTINNQNDYTGQVYATSTAASKNIIYIEK